MIYTANDGQIFEDPLAFIRAHPQMFLAAVAAETEIIASQTGKQTRAARVEIEHKAMPPVTWYWRFEQSCKGWQFGGGSGEGYLEQGERRFFADISWRRKTSSRLPN